MKKQVVGYVRVSSREQSEDTQALKQQIDRVESYGVDLLFCDVASGAGDSRPEFNKMMDAVMAGEANKIVATRWDRLMRSQPAYTTLKAQLQQEQVSLYLLDQGEIDLSTASGEISADIQAILAVHERRLLRERVQKGFEYRRKHKKAWARAPWGYLEVDGAYQLNRRPLVCLLSDRPAHYSRLTAEPDDSPHLSPGISRADIARQVIERLLAGERVRAILCYLYQTYGVEPKRSRIVARMRPVLRFEESTPS